MNNNTVTQLYQYIVTPVIQLASSPIQQGPTQQALIKLLQELVDINAKNPAIGQPHSVLIKMLYDKSSAPGNYLLTHSLTYLLTHSLTHSYSLTHLLLLTHSLTLTDSLPSYAGIVKQSLFNLAKCIAGISVHSINTIIDRLTTDLKSTHSLTYSLLLTHSLTHLLTYSPSHALTTHSLIN